MIPCSGYVYAGRKAIGWTIVLGWAAVAGVVGWYFGRDWQRGLDLVFDPTLLKVLLAALVVLLLVWLFVVWTSYRLIRPRERPRWHTVVGNLAVIVFRSEVLRGGQGCVGTCRSGCSRSH